MKNNDIENEINALKEQIEKLTKTTGKLKPKEEPCDLEKDLLSKIKDIDLKSQVKSLLDTFDKELGGTKPTRLLMVFALGVIVGRLISK